MPFLADSLAFRIGTYLSLSTQKSRETSAAQRLSDNGRAEFRQSKMRSSTLRPTQVLIAMNLSAVKAGTRGLAKKGLMEAGFILSRFRVARSRRGNGLIFTLHHVRPPRLRDFKPNQFLEIAPEFLEAAIIALAEEGYRFVRLDEIPDEMRGNNPRPFAAFTMDDGYQDNFTYALPVFARHNVPFTVFVCTGLLNRTHTMWWETAEVLIRSNKFLVLDFGHGPQTVDLRTLKAKAAAFTRIARLVNCGDEREAVSRIDALAVRYGIDPQRLVAETVISPGFLQAEAKNPLVSIGAHTVAHLALSKLPPAEARREISECREILSDLLGRPITLFAYPYGHVAQVGYREARFAADAGYRMGFTTREATINAAALSQPMLMPRINLSGLYQNRRHVLSLASGIPFRDVQFD